MRDLLLRSWPGRLFIISATLKLLVAPWRSVGGDAPAAIEVIGIAASIGLILSVSYFVWRLIILTKRRLLWRVRRKLILSYIFIGVVPAALIVGFFLVGANTVAINVSAFMFKDGYDDIVSDVVLFAEVVASEVSREPKRAAEILARVQRNGTLKQPLVSMAFVPAAGAKGAPPAARAGRWEHADPPAEVPEWLASRSVGFSGTVALLRDDSSGEAEAVARSVMPAVGPSGTIGYVVADVPISAEALHAIHEDTGVLGGDVQISDTNSDSSEESSVPPIMGGLGQSQEGSDDTFSLFRRSVTFFDSTDWTTGATRRITVALTYRLGELYDRLAMAQQVKFGSLTLGKAILIWLVVVAVLFLIIQVVALVMGLALARSITSSIHALFMGTERVRHGDFAHRIDITTKDQLGELADSFNQMTGSIEGLLQTAAEKKRLDEELRIARKIQMSLLPRGPLDVPGLAITALCVPAREVGGDYYDFFPLPQNRLGVLIADVSGKGTSAALYMAELKGLVLALSQSHQSPRELLIEVNRLISEHLDSRSFITMTYAVIDLARGVMTYCRAGHTPLIFLPGPSNTPPAAQVLTPSGMVLGLRIDGAAEKFAELLEEERIELGQDDVIVLYTDGISEAMNLEQELFGETRLSRIIEEHGHLESGELRERILREIEAFVGTADQHDDMTMILLKFEQASAARMAV